MQLATALLAALALAALAASREARAEDGKQVFLEHECNECHGVEVLGIAKLPPEEGAEEEGEEDPGLGEDEEEKEPPDLSGVAKRHPGDWFPKFLKKKVANEDGKKHRKRFKGSDAELEALVAFLASLETDAPPRSGP
jgi:mono/diheme cytochrome c family protein